MDQLLLRFSNALHERPRTGAPPVSGSATFRGTASSFARPTGECSLC